MKNRVMKAVAIATVMAMTLGLVGCGSSDSTTTDTSADTSTDATTEEASGDTLETAESIEIRIMSNYMEGHSMNAFFESTIAEFEADYPNVTVVVEYIASEDVRASLLTDAASDNYPDIFPIWPEESNLEYIEAGLMMDLTDIFAEDTDWSDGFTGGTLDQFTYDSVDGYYGVPICTNALGFYYNIELFEEAGAEVPETWDELLVVIDQLNAIGVTAWTIGAADTWRTEHLFSTIYYKTYGIDAASGLSDQSLAYDDESILNTFNLMVELVEADAFSSDAIGIDYATEVADFASGTVGMQFNGSWAIGETDGEDTSEEIKGNVGYFEFPTITEEYADQWFGGVSDAFGLSGALEGAELEAAVELVKRLSSSDAAEQIALAGCLPAYDVELDEEEVGSVFAAVVEEMSSAGAFASDFVSFESDVDMNNKFYSYCQAVFAEMITPEEACADLAAACAATEY